GRLLAGAGDGQVEVAGQELEHVVGADAVAAVRRVRQAVGEHEQPLAARLGGGGSFGSGGGGGGGHGKAGRRKGEIGSKKKEVRIQIALYFLLHTSYFTLYYTYRYRYCGM